MSTRRWSTDLTPAATCSLTTGKDMTMAENTGTIPAGNQIMASSMMASTGVALSTVIGGESIALKRREMPELKPAAEPASMAMKKAARLLMAVEPMASMKRGVPSKPVNTATTRSGAGSMMSLPMPRAPSFHRVMRRAADSRESALKPAEVLVLLALAEVGIEAFSGKSPANRDRGGIQEYLQQSFDHGARGAGFQEHIV